MRYINRKGETIDKEEWEAFRADDSYVYVHRFDNGKVKLEIQWVGRLDDRQLANLMEDYYPLYRVSLFNYDANGKALPDPVNHGDTFPNEEQCKEFYEEFLTRWAGAEKKMVQDKKSGLWRDRLVVEGNIHATPEEAAETMAMPESSDDDDDVGSW